MSEILEMLIPAVEEQMVSGETVYVRECHVRLCEDPDIDEEEAKKMIAVCLADEMERMVEEEREFDASRYRALLELLPVMPE